MRPLRTLMNPHELAITSMRQIGGGGGNRTRVQKSSTDSSTYLVLSFEFNLADADTHAAAKRVT